MTIQEMLDRGMSREDVAARLVAAKLAVNLVGARFMIAIALGESEGDVQHTRISEEKMLVRRPGPVPGLSTPVATGELE